MSAILHKVEVDPLAAQAALRHCRDVTRRCARNFYYGLKISPEPQRSAMYALYAWMRTADDLVDRAGESAESIESRLDTFHAATDAALGGRPLDPDPVWIGLADSAAKFPLPAEHFHAMLNGQRDDLERRRYATFDELRDYCYRVASTVGLLCIEIWGYHDPAARNLAVERGIAFQLTNILRDYAQDFDAGRIYLPEDEFTHHGVTPQQLRDWSKPQACSALMKQQIDRAETFYQRSEGLDGMITPSCRPTLWAMTTIYRGLLEKMKADPSRLVLGGRLRLSAARKGAIAIRAKWLSKFGAGAASSTSGGKVQREVSG